MQEVAAVNVAHRSTKDILIEISHLQEMITDRHTNTTQYIISSVAGR